MGTVGSLVSQELDSDSVKHPEVKFYIYPSNHLPTRPCCPICQQRQALSHLCKMKNKTKNVAEMANKWDEMENESRARITWKPTCNY